MAPHATRLPVPRRRRRRWLAAGAFLAGLALVGAMLLEARSLRVTPVTFVSADVPAAFDGLRIAFLSDIHHGPFVSRDRVRATVARVNALHPDVVVLGGDYVYRRASALGPVFAELSRLHAPLGVYGVLGNHDHWLLESTVRPVMAASGVRELYDSGVWLRRGDARLRLCGLSGLADGRPVLTGALGGATQDDFVILVNHSPDVAEALGDSPVDLVLAGHTHGGQVAVFGLWAPFIPSRYGQKYRAGLVLDAPVPTLVTTGVGTITLPLRFFAPPEIVLLTLRRGQGASVGSP
jgi:predicted MPP superfamily phosphohydrolase